MRSVVFLLVALGLTLGGCAGRKTVAQIDRELGNVESVHWSLRDVRTAMAGFMDRAAPPVVAVYEKTLPDDGRLQKLVLANETATRGENYVLVEMRVRNRPSGLTRLFGAGPARKRREASRIAEDPRKLFDQEFGSFAEPWGFSDRLRWNAAGPYYHAVATARGDVSCVLAWTPPDDDPRVRDELVVNMRARICAPNAEPEDLLAVVDSFYVESPDSDDPRGDTLFRSLDEIFSGPRATRAEPVSRVYGAAAAPRRAGYSFEPPGRRRTD